jgi:hypothetical protein
LHVFKQLPLFDLPEIFGATQHASSSTLPILPLKLDARPTQASLSPSKKRAFPASTNISKDAYHEPPHKKRRINRSSNLQHRGRITSYQPSNMGSLLHTTHTPQYISQNAHPPSFLPFPNRIQNTNPFSSRRSSRATEHASSSTLPILPLQPKTRSVQTSVNQNIPAFSFSMFPNTASNPNPFLLSAPNGFFASGDYQHSDTHDLWGSNARLMGIQNIEAKPSKPSLHEILSKLGHAANDLLQRDLLENYPNFSATSLSFFNSTPAGSHKKAYHKLSDDLRDIRTIPEVKNRKTIINIPGTEEKLTIQISCVEAGSPYDVIKRRNHGQAIMFTFSIGDEIVTNYITYRVSENSKEMLGGLLDVKKTLNPNVWNNISIWHIVQLVLPISELCGDVGFLLCNDARTIVNKLVPNVANSFYDMLVHRPSIYHRKLNAHKINFARVVTPCFDKHSECFSRQQQASDLVSFMTFSKNTLLMDYAKLVRINLGNFKNFLDAIGITENMISSMNIKDFMTKILQTGITFDEQTSSELLDQLFEDPYQINKKESTYYARHLFAEYKNETKEQAAKNFVQDLKIQDSKNQIHRSQEDYEKLGENIKLFYNVVHNHMEFVRNSNSPHISNEHIAQHLYEQYECEGVVLMKESEETLMSPIDLDKTFMEPTVTIGALSEAHSKVKIENPQPQKMGYP